MRQHTYKLNGITYKRTRKDKAIKLLETHKDLSFFLVPANVNCYHFHSGWHLASHPMTSKDLGHFAICKLITHFSWYNCCHELGYYPSFYVEVR